MAAESSFWRGRLGRAAARLGLVVAGVALPLLALESVLRVTGLDEPAGLDETFDRPFEYYRPQPARLNPWSAGHPDPLRIAVIGDSFTQGQGNHGYDAYPSRLEALLNLNAGQRPAEVRTGAQRGSSTAGQRKFLRLAIEWEPDILILGIFPNDTELAADHVLDEMRRALRPRVPEGMLSWVLRRSAALAWVYQRLENLRCSRAVRAYYGYIYDPEYEGFKRFERSLRAFKRTTQAHDVEFLPVIFPGMAARGSQYRLGAAHERIHTVLEAQRLEYLDLFDAFSNTMPLRMSAFPVIDPHPSEIAHRIAADAIFHRLLGDGTIDAGYYPRRIERKGRREWLEEVRRMKSVVHLAPDP